MKGMIPAFRFLTRLPMPSATVVDADFTLSMRWFPMVGAAIGVMVAGGCRLGALVDPWTGAMVGLLVWVLVTGALHLDGLSDLADAGGAAHQDRERLLAVLADPHVGSFGVVAIALQLIAKLVLLHASIAQGFFGPLILVPFAARAGVLAWTYWLPPLHQGLAWRFRSAVRPIDLALWTLVLIASAWFAPTLLIAPFLIALWGWWLRRTIGGISGDGHGAGIELVETGLLIGLAVAGAMA